MQLCSIPQILHQGLPGSRMRLNTTNTKASSPGMHASGMVALLLHTGTQTTIQHMRCVVHPVITFYAFYTINTLFSQGGCTSDNMIEIGCESSATICGHHGQAFHIHHWGLIRHWKSFCPPLRGQGGRMIFSHALPSGFVWYSFSRMVQDIFSISMNIP